MFNFSEKLLDVLIFMPGFLFSLSCHEAAHAWVASLFGDNTAKRLGRITLNPVAHSDPVGTLLLPVIGIFTGFFIGWGIPVPIDERNLKHVRRDAMWISLAGPMANLILAVLIAQAFKWFTAGGYMMLPGYVPQHVITTLADAFQTYFFLNLAMFVFNLIPIHPLDGGKIIGGILPKQMAIRFDDFMARYGMMILLVLIFTGAIRWVILPPLVGLAKLLLG